MSFHIEEISPVDFPKVLDLNQQSQPHLSALTLERLKELAKITFHFRIIKQQGKIAAFLMGMEENQLYDSVNYAWISERYESFYYIDRIAVAKKYQRQGLGMALYKDSQSFALQKKKSIMACEVNIKPPNPESIYFHKKYGFYSVGTQNTEQGKKTVQYMIKDLI